MKTAAQAAAPGRWCNEVAKKQGKQWSGMTSVGRVVLVLFLLFAFFSFLAQGIVSNAQGNGFRAACQTNLKQLGLAMEQYTQDSDSQLPPVVDRTGKRTWREALYPYVEAVGVYHCPNDVYTEQNGYSPQSLPRSYAANHTGWDKAVDKGRVITLVDVRGDDGSEWDMTSPFYARSSARELYLHKPTNPLFLKRPSATLNVLFADGHVKRVAPVDTLEPINLWTRHNAPFTGPDLMNAQAILKQAENE